MALFHIPLFQERSQFGTIFGDTSDWSFTPRYCRIIHSPYHKLQRKSDVMREKEEDNTFKVSLDVRNYEPRDISLNVDGDKLLVKGKRYKKNEFGFEKSEFERVYPIPSDVEVESLKSRINDDGLLEIEAPKKKQEAIQDNDQAVQQDENKFKAVFDVTQYKPDEVSVKVQGKQVIVHGEQKSECKEDDEEMFVHHRQFTRRFVLPETVELDSLQSKWTKDGKLVIEAEKYASIEAEARQLEIKHEVEEEKKEEQS